MFWGKEYCDEEASFKKQYGFLYWLLLMHKILPQLASAVEMAHGPNKNIFGNDCVIKKQETIAVSKSINRALHQFTNIVISFKLL